MRFIPIVILFSGLLIGQPAQASTGLGLMGGEPTGISAQFELGGQNALNGALGLDVLGDKDLYLHLDYVFLMGPLLRGSAARLPFYVGLGGFFVASKSPGIGARVPFGLQLDFRRAPLQLFAEIALRLRVVDHLKVGVGGALGFRIFF